MTAEALQIKEMLAIESARGLEDSLQMAVLSEATEHLRDAGDSAAKVGRQHPKIAGNGRFSADSGVASS
jgi:hypothetical protein